MTIGVLVADDQALVRSGLVMIVESQPDLSVVAEAPDGARAVEISHRRDIDVILMDVQMPVLDGIDATRSIRARDEAPKVLMLTTFDCDEHVFAALKAGASGFLLKSARAEEVIDGIRAVHRGDAVVAASAMRRLLDQVVPTLPGAQKVPATLSRLTSREQEVLMEVATGASNAEIAARLFLSEATVKTHVGRVLMKLNLRDRVQVVVLAYETGLVRPAP